MSVFSLSAQDLFESSLAEGDTDFGKSPGINFEIPGYVRTNVYTGENADSGRFEFKQAQAEFALQPRFRDKDYGSAFADIRINNTYGNVVDLHEAYIDAYAGNFNIKAGKQVVVWGKADGINPTNVITPQNMSVFSPNEDDSRDANVLIRSFYNFNPFRLEFIWVPVYGATTLPEFSLPSSIVFADLSYPDNSVSNSSAALKFSYEAASIDASISYYDGWSVTPGFDYAGMQGTDVVVSLCSYRTRSIGADFSSSVFSPFGLRGEVAYKRPDHPGFNEYTPKPELYYILGVDREFIDGRLSVILQYIGKHVFSWGLPSSGTAPEQIVLSQVFQKNMLISGQQEKWSHSASLRPAYSMLNEILKAEALVMINFSTKELLLKSKLTYSISDMLSTAVGVDYYYGTDNTLFDLIGKYKSAVYAELKLYFM
ncbi:MAG: hypothetical protein JXA66_04830 [Oligoflexia bacterium]|nr:hypothetical protein [Oligoflexia bacterium]